MAQSTWGDLHFNASCDKFAAPCKYRGPTRTMREKEREGDVRFARLSRYQSRPFIDGSGGQELCAARTTFSMPRKFLYALSWVIALAAIKARSEIYQGRFIGGLWNHF